VRLFAIAKQIAETDFIDVDIPAGGTVGDVRAAIIARHHQLAQVLNHVLFSVDAEYATDAVKVHEDSEIGCIPPVSGG
jgi:molybdopterin synthase catalytic subunit/molybdopterin synthase sulfur carrier subunit